MKQYKIENDLGSTLRLRRLWLRLCRASVPSETRQSGSRKGQAVRLQKMRLQVVILNNKILKSSLV